MAFKKRKNVINLKRIEINMTKENVIKIMGKPDFSILSFLNDVDSMYCYEPPFAAADGIYIQFNKKNEVNGIIGVEDNQIGWVKN